MKKISLSRWTNIAEIIGMIAVVVSLIFVGLEIRQNTDQVKATSLQSGVEFVKSIYSLTETKEKASLIYRGLDDFDNLSFEEKMVFDSELSKATVEFESIKTLYNQGNIEESYYKSYEQFIANIYSTPGGYTWFKRTNNTYPEETILEIEQMVAQNSGKNTMLDYYQFKPSEESAKTPTNLQHPNTSNEPLNGLIIFAFYKDVEAAEDFYVNIMGLKKSYHRDITRVFQVTPGAAIGLMDHAASPDTNIDNKDMGFSFIVQNTENVDRWYEYLKSHDVNIYAPPSDGTRTPVRSVHFYDPEGYDIEIFAWLPDAEMIKE